MHWSHRSICRSRCAGGSTTGPPTAVWRRSSGAGWPPGGAGGWSTDHPPDIGAHWHYPCRIPTGRCVMKRVFLVAVLAVAILSLSTGATLAAPGEPRVVQGTLGWPAAVSTQPFVVIRGDDGRMYYADINSAQ